MKLSENNRRKFDELQELKLPTGHYAVTASGPLGIRGIRDVDDLDLIVDDELWEQLSQKHKPEGQRIQVSSNVEASREQGFEPDPSGPTVAEQINTAEMISGIPFVQLDHLIYWKTKMGRNKDKRDLELIRDWLSKQP